MKNLKKVFALMLFISFVFCLSDLIFALDKEVKVTVQSGNVRLKPSLQSTVVGKVPLGSTFKVIETQGEWFKIKLPPDGEGFVVSGYIHSSVVEIIEVEEPEEKIEPEEEQKVIKEEKEIKEAQTQKVISPPPPPPPVKKPAPVYQDKKSSMFEISLVGGYFLSTGKMSAGTPAADLYSGKWSPWFGDGYDSYIWSWLSPPQTDPLDNVIGNAIVNQKGGIIAGLNLGYNLSPMFQIELMFRYGFSGLVFDDAAWSEIVECYNNSVDAMGNNYDVTPINNSVQSAGNTFILGLNFNINFMQGQLIPYFSVGAGIVVNSDSPSVHYKFTNHLSSWVWGETEATYTLDVTYQTKIAIAPNAGIGFKIFMGDNFGIKVEARGVYAPLSLDQNIKTTFTDDSAFWIEFDDYDKVGVTQKGSRIIVIPGIGFFFSF